MISEHRTSREEQTLFFYISKFYPDAVNQGHVSKYEVDILIESLKCIVEFDGGYWHANKIDADYQKTIGLNELGYFVIRVRDISLEKLPTFNGTVIIYDEKDNAHRFGNLPFVVATIRELSKLEKNPQLIERIADFSLKTSEYLLDLPKIVAPLHQTPTEGSVAECFGSEMWDYKENGDLDPHNLKYRLEGLKAHFICPMGVKCFDRVDKWCIPTVDERVYDLAHRLIIEWGKTNCTYVKWCKKRKCFFKTKLFTFLVENRVPLDQLHATYESLPFEEYFGSLLSFAFSDNDSTYLDSIVRHYYLNHTHVPCNWVSDREDFELLKKFTEYAKSKDIKLQLSTPFSVLDKRLGKRETWMEEFNKQRGL